MVLPVSVYPTPKSSITSTHLLLQSGFSALGTVSQRRVGQLLDGLQRMSAFLTTIFVNGHSALPVQSVI